MKKKKPLLPHTPSSFHQCWHPQQLCVFHSTIYKKKKKSSKHSDFSSWGLWFKYPWSDNFQKDKPWVVWEQITWHSNVVSFRSREGTGRILFFYKKVVGYWAIFEEGICGLSLPPTPSPKWDNLLSHSHAFCYVPMWSRAGGNSGPPTDGSVYSLYWYNRLSSWEV